MQKREAPALRYQEVQIAMELNDIRIFMHVVRVGSFTGAAEQLGLPKSTVSRRLAVLEAELGTRLIERTTRKLRTTELGSMFYERTSRSVDELEAASRFLTDLDEVPRGVLRLTAPVDLAAMELAPIMTEFRQSYPEVEIALLATGRYVDLVGEGYDLAIRTGELQDSSLMARKLASMRFGLFASPEHLSRRGTPETVMDLSSRECLIFGTGETLAQWTLSSETEHHEVQVRGVLACNDNSVLQGAAVAGMGIALLPTTCCADDVRAGRLSRVLSEFATEAIPNYAVYPSAQLLTPKVRAFIDFISERLGAEN